MKNAILSAAVLVMLLVASAIDVHAGLLQLDESQFDAAVGGTAVIEDFEGFSTGTHPNPFVFANGRYTSPSTNLSPVRIFDFWGPTNRLASATGEGVRTFDRFSSGTTLVGLDMWYVNPATEFAVTVTGGSGVLNLPVQTGDSLGEFLGFYDPLGITSISFERTSNDVNYNYSFDNIRTSTGAPVPEPASIALLSIGAAGVAALRRRRNANPPN